MPPATWLRKKLWHSRSTMIWYIRIQKNMPYTNLRAAPRAWHQAPPPPALCWVWTSTVQTSQMHDWIGDNGVDEEVRSDGTCSRCSVLYPPFVLIISLLNAEVSRDEWQDKIILNDCIKWSRVQIRPLAQIWPSHPAPTYRYRLFDRLGFFQQSTTDGWSAHRGGCGRGSLVVFVLWSLQFLPFVFKDRLVGQYVRNWLCRYVQNVSHHCHQGGKAPKPLSHLSVM